MKKTQRIYVFLGFAALCWLIVGGWAMFNGRQGSSVDPIYNDVFSAMTTNPDYVYQYDGEVPDFGTSVFGAIMPSPAANSTLTASTMAALQKCWSTKLVLVVSFGDNLGEKAITSKKDWQTSFGVIQTNSDAVDHILGCGAVIDDQKMAKMSDYFDLLPYFAYYFPDKNMIPLVFDSSVNLAYMEEFMDQLAGCNDGYKVLFLIPDQDSEQPLFTSSTDELTAFFDASETSSYGGVLTNQEDAALSCMKHILQYDGNDVLNVLCETTDRSPTFDQLTILYGNK